MWNCTYLVRRGFDVTYYWHQLSLDQYEQCRPDQLDQGFNKTSMRDV